MFYPMYARPLREFSSDERVQVLAPDADFFSPAWTRRAMALNAGPSSAYRRQLLAVGPQVHTFISEPGTRPGNLPVALLKPGLIRLARYA